MEQKESRKRKCGPRVKTGCITCRIRRVKCGEEKPECARCTSTGRKCDGYTQPQHNVLEKRKPLLLTANKSEAARSLEVVSVLPVSTPGTQREKQLFHFYCVQSAADLSVYLNSSFWYNKILQYSQQNPVVRQAVIAFGASHVYAISRNSSNDPKNEVMETYEQAMQYDKAIRFLRNYIEKDPHPDPQVILICCALFFNCENGRGNREAALQHLEQGLSILNAEHRKRINDSTTSVGSDHSNSTDRLIGPSETHKSEIDEELLYLFSRLDCQATLCQESRVPVLDLDTLAGGDGCSISPFYTVTDAQRSLDLLHNRLAKFLTRAGPYGQEHAESLPPWVVQQKHGFSKACVSWEQAMNSFISSQSSSVRQIIQYKRATDTPDDPDWRLAIQIQLLVLHHRCWWMLFRSSYPQNPTVFTMSPNPRAEEILDVCEFLGFSLPVRPSPTADMNEADVVWKLISEIGVAAPLFVLATKCTDRSIQARAMRQLNALREHRSGIYDKMFLSRVISNITQHAENIDDLNLIALTQGFQPEVLEPEANESLYGSPHSVSDSEGSSFSRSTSLEAALKEEPRELLGWGRKSSVG